MRESLRERIYEQRKPVTIVRTVNMRIGNGAGITAANNTGIHNPIYVVPDGMQLAIHRFSITCPNNEFTFGNPYTNAGDAYWYVCYGVNANVPTVDASTAVIQSSILFGASLRAGAGSLPVALTWGTRDAPVVSGEPIVFQVVQGPPSTVIQIKFQGTLSFRMDATKRFPKGGL